MKKARIRIPIYLAAAAMSLGLAPGASAATSTALNSAVPIRQTVPQPDRDRIAARFGATYIPRWLPPGFVYVGWKELPGSASAYGTFLEIDFASRGSVLEWVVGDGRDPDRYGYNACLPRPNITPSYGDRILYVKKQRVVFVHGNHGSTAAVCIGDDLRRRLTDPMWAGTAIYVWVDSANAVWERPATVAASWTRLPSR